MAKKIIIGDNAMYEGIMLARRGQHVKVISVLDKDCIGLRFPDGAKILCHSKGVEPIAVAAA
jgi:hypothetical protein